ncbi:MAG: VCBS repeat-containing protein [Bryobacteraceae bacterium]|jgi:VCBS repeat protein/FG-GAP repeat protein
MYKSFSIAAIGLMTLPAGLFAIDFNAPRAYSVGKGFSAYSLVTGDFNGDGIPDVAVTVYSYSIPCCSVEVYLGQPGGGLQHAGNYELVSDWLNSNSLITADFNNDGHLDLAVAGNTGFAILLGNGDGTFGAPVTYTTGTEAYAIATADFNGDGIPDIATANPGANNVSVLLGNGDGTFQPPMSFGVGTAPRDLAVGDFNRDGKPDLAVTNYSSGTVSILFGVGNGTFNPAVSYPAGTDPTSIAVGDFNKDGRPDLAVTLYNGGVSILLGAGGGTFLPPVTVDAGPEPAAIVVADVNGDGNLDLAVANQFDYSTNTEGYTVSILKGNGDGTFQAPEPYDVPSFPTSIAFNDFNGGGKLDLVVAAFGGVSILPNNGHGGLADMVNDPAGTAPSSIATGDFNGDGKPDLVVANKGSNNVSILIGNGDGTFQPQVTYDTIGDPISVVVGDFNGDGKLDLAVASSTAVAVMFGNGDGSFQPPLTSAIPVYGQMVAADFDGDGKTDLAVINACQCSAVTLLSNGDGTFQQLPLNGPEGSLQYLAVGDFNGDGIPDLVVQTAIFGYYFTAEYVSIWQGNGHGYFYIVDNFDGEGPVTVADFNGEGRADLAGGAYGGVWVVMGNGPDSFGGIAYYPAQSPIALATGDFNGDGKVDLAMLGFSAPVGSSDTISILLNYGLGKFQAQKEWVVGGCAAALAVADFNGDGLSDIATANSCSNDVTILKNTTE